MEQSGNSIYFYLEVAYRRKWLIIVPIVVCTIIGAIAFRFMTPYYNSTTLILVEQQQVPEAYVTPTDKTPFNQRLNTIRQQIISRPKLEKIIDSFNLYGSNAGDGKQGILHRAMSVLGIKSNIALNKEDALALILKNIDVKVIGDRGSQDAFIVGFTGTEPHVTMEVTNTLASLFIEENLRSREQYAEGTSDFISEELENAKKELASQEGALRNFREKYMGSLPEQLDTNLRTLDRLQLELQSVSNELKNADERKALLEAQLGQADDASTFISSNSLSVELERLQKDLASLLSIYKETYPDVVITKKRIKDIKEQLARSGEDTVNNMDDEFQELRPEVRNPLVYNNLLAVKSQISSLKERNIQIRKQIDLFEKRVEDTPANEQKLTALRRDYDMSLKNYQTLLEKKLSAKLAENLEKRQKGERFKIINPANLPEKPFKPRKTAVIMAGAMTGAGIGAGLVFLLELMNPAFRKPEDFDGVFSQPVLASIPVFYSTAERNENRSGFFKKIKHRFSL